MNLIDMTLHEWCSAHKVQAWQHASNPDKYYLPDGIWSDRAKLFSLDDFIVSSIEGGTIWFYSRAAIAVAEHAMLPKLERQG